MFTMKNTQSKKMTIDEKLNILKEHYLQFLNYHKAKFPVYHNSNVFEKDLHHSVRKFLALKGISVKADEWSKLTSFISGYLEAKKILIPVYEDTWRVEYPKFRTGEPYTYELAEEYS